MDVLEVWKQMGEERRKQAATDFFNDDSLREFRAAAHGYIAKMKNFRPQFVKRLPVEKRTSYLATLPLSAELAAQLLVSWFFAHQRPMMTAFLDALEIPNDQGMIKEEVELKPPSAEAIDTAVDALRGYSAEEVNLYLSTLVSQNPEVWGGLERIINKAEARTA
jgi:hypothetical protein